MLNHDWDAAYDPDDEPWDEEQWEAFLRESDRRTDRYMELLHDFLRSNPRPDPDDASALDAWKRALRAFIQRKGWTRDDIVLPFLWLGESDDETDDLEWIDAFDFDDDVGEEPMSSEDLFAEDPLDDVPEFGLPHQLPVYRQSLALTDTVMEWADAVPGDVKDSTLVQYCSNVLQIPAKVAKGHAFGFEQDTIGGNIACVKRGLAAANAALTLLRRLKRESYIDDATYHRLYEQTYEVRNALGIYVQELRERFNLGID